MTILDALQNKQIRYSDGHYFDATTQPGSFHRIDTWEELPGLLNTVRESYVGSAFVRFDEEMPADVPTNRPAHTWASALFVGPNYEEYAGAIVIWSTDENEAAHRASQPARIVSLDQFNVRRAGGDA
jgi:hypothetical protein